MHRFILVFVFAALSCQGPWSYWPDDPENYQGIWTYAYIISGRPVENVCFDKIHALGEVRMQGFAFYEEASVEISGTFNGEETSFFLSPQTGKPNCFFGPYNMQAEAGKNYELNASITWDSAGKRVTSKFSAKTYIPQKFKVKRAYDLEGKEFKEHDTIIYLPPPMDMKSNYFIPEYSDDVAAAIVSRVYPDDVFWGENSINKIIEQFDPDNERNDTARYARFGDRSTLAFVQNQEFAGTIKEIDSIPIIGMNMPAIGNLSLLFYATTSDYVKFRETFLSGMGDSRVKAVYNIEGGAGIFAGMMVDTFKVSTKTLPEVKIYPYLEAQKSYCFRLDTEFDVEYWRVRRQCVEIWDSILWYEVSCGKKSEDECGVRLSGPWYTLPSDKLKEILSMSELITWCEHRDFPVDMYPLCGSALVHYSKEDGKNSLILDREVKKWCEEHKDDSECQN